MYSYIYMYIYAFAGLKACKQLPESSVVGAQDLRVSA